MSLAAMKYDPVLFKKAHEKFLDAPTSLNDNELEQLRYVDAHLGDRATARRAGYRDEEFGDGPISRGEFMRLVRDIQAPVIATLKTRIAEIEQTVASLARVRSSGGVNQDALDDVAIGVADATREWLRPWFDRIEALEKRPAMQYRGVFEHGRTYEPGDVVTKAGSLWCCLETTTSVPGAADTPAGRWQLCVKRGADGKDGKDAA